MKRLFRTVIPALFILTAAATNLGAQEIFPANGTVSLPELSSSTALAMHLTKVDIAVGLADDSGKILPGAKLSLAQWSHGTWKDRKGNNIAQILLPTQVLQENPAIKAQYIVKYKIHWGSKKAAEITEYLPADKSASFFAKTAFPVQPVIIDGSGLAYSRPGLAAVKWVVNSQLGTTAAKNQGLLKANRAAKDGMPINKTAPVTADIDFICYGGRQIKWAGSGKDLRKLAPDLVIKLAQPDCSGKEKGQGH